MAKTYIQIQAQITKLQLEAEALKAKEIAGVIARIQEAIAHYGLTPADLFGKAAGPVRYQPAARTATRRGKAPTAAKPTKLAKAPAPAKYHDGAGHQWSGIGKRPNWFKDALAAGKTAADLLVNKPAA